MRIDASLEKRSANFVPLTPVDFLKRSVEVYPDKAAVHHATGSLSYRDLGQLVGRIAAALARSGIGPGDIVSIAASNRPEMLAMHYAVPMLGAVLNTLNTRLEPSTLGYIIGHAESRLVFCDGNLSSTVTEAIRLSGQSPLLVSFDGFEVSHGVFFETFIADTDPLPITLDAITDEWQPICLNYTSGTTGQPKGVVYHHRGAYLNSLGNVIGLGFDADTVYLWTLPMFHCNGWQHPWAVTAVGGTHVCLDRIDPVGIYHALESRKVTHFCCAPVILYLLLNHPNRSQYRPQTRVRVGTGGASPTTALIAELDALGIELIHLYGLTESYGPATLCALRSDWQESDSAAKARLLSRQGVRHPLAAEVDVIDPSGSPIPADGTTLGEIAIRSNTLMAGYYKDSAGSDRAFADGVFRTGDIAVRHPDGYLEIKDRSKDIIISGGENISSLEVENILHQHPAVMIAAVVAIADLKWGEVPCACIELKPGVAVPDASQLIDFCRERLAHFKVPRRIIYREIPKTATGKIQKFVLRKQLADS